MLQDSRKPFSIGYVAKVTGVNASTLRSWERSGLLTPAKSDGGRRTFDDRDVRRVQEIDRLRRVYGYSLMAVRHTLERQDSDNEPAAQAGSDASRAPQRETIGSRVRTLRTDAGLTLRQFAEKAGLAASYVSTFERGSTYPSPARLNAIARALGLTLADLLGSTKTEGEPIIRKGKGRAVGTFGPGVSIEQLSVGEGLMDCEIWTIQPGAESEGFYAHVGEELIHVLNGEFELALDGNKPEVLNSGDSVYFDSSRQHRWRNPGPVPAVVLWVNTDPDRLAALVNPQDRTMLGLGAPVGDGLGERVHKLALGNGTKSFRVVDTHTAGHPTRILLEPLDGIDGSTVREKRDQFRERFDHLRPLLLHEPRGHAATFGLIPVASAEADFGAIFVSSYKYLDMCGHGTIGYARALAALGRLNGRRSFTLETPAGLVVVRLGLHGSPANVTVENVLSFVSLPSLPLPEIAAGCEATIAYGGCWYANVPAGFVGLSVEPDNVSKLMAIGGRIKDAVNAELKRRGARPSEIDSVLFYENAGRSRGRQIVILERNKFDRSPCGTGLSARMAQLVAEGRLRSGESLEVENVLGVPFLGRVLSEAEVDGRAGIMPEITGTAHLSGFSTLIVEADDPLSKGFLCR